MYHSLGRIGGLGSNLVEQLQTHLANGVNPYLEQIGVSVAQALLDLQRLKELTHLRQPEAQSELETMYQRYQAAKPSPKGSFASVAYRLRNLLLDLFYSAWASANAIACSIVMARPSAHAALNVDSSSWARATAMFLSISIFSTGSKTI